MPRLALPTNGGPHVRNDEVFLLRGLQRLGSTQILGLYYESLVSDNPLAADACSFRRCFVS